MSPVPPPRYERIGPNRAKSGQIGPGYGGAPLLITPERRRTAEVGEWSQIDHGGTKRNETEQN